MTVEGVVIYIGDGNNAFQQALLKKHHVISVRSGKQALAQFGHHQPDCVVVDAISMKTTGERIVSALKSADESVAVIHMLPEMSKREINSRADQILVMPFTSRKVMNAVNRSLEVSRLYRQQAALLTVGPFALDVDRRILIAYGEEHVLSPKKALLLDLFMRREGETIDRKEIMERVWDTTYIGDTRTLSVHIRWLRDLLEPDGQPPVLQTIRGVGYQFKLPD